MGLAAAGSAASNLDSWLGGAQAGFNWQIYRIVLGLEGDIQATGQRDNLSFCATSGCPAGSAIGTSSTKLPWLATVRGRLGYAISPLPALGPILLYATGGLAVAEIQESYTSGLVGGPISTTGFNTTRGGGTVGAGAETRIGQTNWTFKLEYLYMDFGHVSGSVASVSPLVVTPIGVNDATQVHLLATQTTTAGTAITHVTDQILRVGFNYKFSPF